MFLKINNLSSNLLNVNHLLVMIHNNSIQSIECHFGIFYIFGYKPKYSYTIIYECENLTLSYELS